MCGFGSHTGEITASGAKYATTTAHQLFANMQENVLSFCFVRAIGAPYTELSGVTICLVRVTQVKSPHVLRIANSQPQRISAFERKLSRHLDSTHGHETQPGQFSVHVPMRKSPIRKFLNKEIVVSQASCAKTFFPCTT